MTRYSRVVNREYDVSDKESNPDDAYLEYLAHNKDGDAISRLVVQHHPEVSATQESNFHTGKPVVDDEMTHTDTPVNESNLDITPYTRYAEPGEQLVMFGHRNVPAKRVVTGLYSENSLAGKTSAMNLIGIANNASTEAIGKNVVPDKNLSVHSGALVDRLHAEGHIPSEDMPKGRTAGDVMNSHTFWNSGSVLANRHMGAYTHGVDTLEDLSSRVPAARTRIRDLLGNAKKGEEHTQLSLWDD